MSDGTGDTHFFENTYHHLPQELRMVIYDELLTEHMMHKIAACTSPTAYAYLHDHIVFKYRSTPRVLDNCFAVDIIKAFYCKYSDFEVKYLLRTATLLQRDSFKLVPSAKFVKDPPCALTVAGSLLFDDKYYIDLRLPPAHFASLSNSQQRLAPNFHFTIRLWTDTSSRTSAKENSAQGMALRRTLQALKPLFAKLVEKAPKVTQSVVLEVARRHKAPLNIALAEKSPQILARTIFNWCF
ncbi:hypothetical protein G6011_04813 [Alternaria panax]|uniref:Uncharacterized protein n=1 Tax=Alternaria panax TaxID=48097 RepID=A0AAD4IH78_9PLEO|nr:hypothetical protein G6011_04813 [Alternaria panax]